MELIYRGQPKFTRTLLTQTADPETKNPASPSNQLRRSNQPKQRPCPPCQRATKISARSRVCPCWQPTISLKTLMLMETALETGRSDLENATMGLSSAKQRHAPNDVLIGLQDAIAIRQSHVDRLILGIKTGHEALTRQQEVVQLSQAWLLKTPTGEDVPKPPGI